MSPPPPAPSRAVADGDEGQPGYRPTREHTRGRAWPIRVLGLFSSLLSAATLIAVVTVVLGVATYFERDYGREAAAVLVYGSWWFTGLFLLLAVNIFGAAAVRYPWRRNQYGFVVVHLGLLTLIAGFLMSAGRLDGLLLAEPAKDASTIELPEDALTVTLGADSHRIQFQPLAFAGHPSFLSYLAGAGPFRTIDAPLVHAPAPRPVLRGEGGEGHAALPEVSVRRVVLTGREKLGYLPARPESSAAPAAVKIEVTGRFPAMPAGMMVPIASRWLGGGGETMFEAGAAASPLAMVIGEARQQALVDGFLAAKPVAAPTLVVHWAGKRHDLVIDPAALPLDAELADDLAVSVTRAIDRPVFTGSELLEDAEAGFDPLLVVRIGTGAGEARSWRQVPVFAFYPCFELGARAASAPAGPETPGLLYEHPRVYAPEGGGPAGANVQLLVGPDRRLHVRWFSRSKGLGGTATVGADGRWSGTVVGSDKGPMQLMLSLTHLPRAEPGPEPVRMIPDQADRSWRWLEFMVRRGDAVGSTWLARGQRGTVTLSNGEQVGLSYSRAVRDLAKSDGFAIRLDRFHEGKDPGGSMSASFASDVTVVPSDGSPTYTRLITMNAPLTVNGATLYQSSFIPETDAQGERTGRFLASVFTVATDPGRLLKYLGSTLLVAGILLMYAMRNPKLVPLLVPLLLVLPLLLLRRYLY